MYKAIDIAKYIINKSIDFNRPISNLQLQKILYYVQGEYIKVTKGCKLFDEDLEAWAYGPVVPEVYYEFNKLLELQVQKFIKFIINIHLAI